MVLSLVTRVVACLLAINLCVLAALAGAALADAALPPHRLPWRLPLGRLPWRDTTHPLTPDARVVWQQLRYGRIPLEDGAWRAGVAMLLAELRREGGVTIWRQVDPTGRANYRCFTQPVLPVLPGTSAATPLPLPLPLARLADQRATPRLAAVMTADGTATGTRAHAHASAGTVGWLYRCDEETAVLPLAALAGAVADGAAPDATEGGDA